MNKILLLNVINFVLAHYCIGQSLVVDAKSKDVLVFQFNNKDVRLLEEMYMNPVYQSDKLLVETRRWAQYGTGYFEKWYSFSMGGDTMRISCGCGQQRHLFFKICPLKKGNLSWNSKSLRNSRLREETFPLTI